MYTNNKYVLQKDKRVKLGFFKSVIFYIIIIISLFISFFPFSRLEDVVWSFLIITLLIVFICILSVIEILEKQKRTIFFIFAFTCFLCIFCSLISEFIYGIVYILFFDIRIYLRNCENIYFAYRWKAKRSPNESVFSYWHIGNIFIYPWNVIIVFQ